VGTPGHGRRRGPVLAPLLVVALMWTGGLMHARAADGDRPPPVRVGVPAPVAPGEGGFAFLVPGADGAPVAFDPCRPVHWVLRPDGEPPGGRAVVEQAFAEVSRATGLRFVFDGLTDEAPAEERARVQPYRYGERWSPVLVAWSTEHEVAALSGRRVGSGVASWTDAGGRRLVSGQLVLDRVDLTDGRGELRPLAAGTALHELAHVVGLGHVDDRAQLMHPVMGERGAFGDGDLRGLHALGSVPCS
jgi:hypothetical protein